IPECLVVSPFIFMGQYDVRVEKGDRERESRPRRLVYLLDVESYMQRIFVRKLVISLVAVALIGLSILSISLVVQARQNQRIVLSGQTVPLLKHAHLIGTASAQQKLDLSVGLQLRNQQELENLLSNMYNPRSSEYHHFLSTQMFANEFG